MMLAVAASESRRGEEIELLWYGDCAALLKQGDAAVTVVGETFDKRAAEAMRARAVAKQHNLSPASGFNRPEFIGNLRAARNRINSGNYWLFSPDARAAVTCLAPGYQDCAGSRAAARHRRFSGAGQ